MGKLKQQIYVEKEHNTLSLEQNLIQKLKEKTSNINRNIISIKIYC